MKLPSSLPLLLFLSVFLVFSHAQIHPSYQNNAQLNCDVAGNGTDVLGDTCDEAQRACSTYLSFRSQTNYQTPFEIASLLSSNSSSISELNGLTNGSLIPIDDLVIIPTTCSCFGNYFQHNATYTLRDAGHTYFTIANDTYQGLSTCQALISQNPYDSRHLTIGMKIQVPLRCACPTTDQITRSGVKYLLTYLVTWGDDIPTIAEKLKSDSQSILDANGLRDVDVIYPFTTLLIPINTEPTKAQVQSLQPPVPSPPLPLPPASNRSTTKWLYVGIGTGAGFLIFCGILTWYFRGHRSEANRTKQGNNFQ